MQLQIKRLTCFLFIFSILLFPFFSFAITGVGLMDNEINIETIPENPQPYQDVTIKITSYATDLNKALIKWSDGSNVVLSGIGKTSYSFKALGPNSFSIFDIQITPTGSINTTTKRVVVIPSEIEVMWESVDGYTPPFYRGKSFVSAEGIIKVVAIPNTNTIKSGKGNISYIWKNNDNTQLDASGYGKDSYIFKNTTINDRENVTVVASSINGDYSAEKTIEIPIVSPKLIFYKKSPTDGVLYNNALNKEMAMVEEEMTVVGEPYFLSIKGKEGSFNYNWKINGSNIQTPTKKTELTIRPNSRGGYATINLVIENINELFQTVNNSLKINL